MESPSLIEEEVEGGRMREKTVSSSMMFTRAVMLSDERRGEVGVPAAEKTQDGEQGVGEEKRREDGVWIP